MPLSCSYNQFSNQREQLWFTATIPQRGTEFKTLSKLADPKASTPKDPVLYNEVVGACETLRTMVSIL